ncbi:2S seed storage protein 5 [Frankliniella fusca]|uniref:2S seed storage protein 5 n=1 Tax=Frankliniella fusca TaxID=407009 RepID=A0AAE1HW13_9NEOP|nr:2S seed storage protein 5 [Frankliniella fusca]
MFGSPLCDYQIWGVQRAKQVFIRGHEQRGGKTLLRYRRGRGRNMKWGRGAFHEMKMEVYCPLLAGFLRARAPSFSELAITRVKADDATRAQQAAREGVGAGALRGCGPSVRERSKQGRRGGALRGTGTGRHRPLSDGSANIHPHNAGGGGGRGGGPGGAKGNPTSCSWWRKLIHE